MTLEEKLEFLQNQVDDCNKVINALMRRVRSSENALIELSKFEDYSKNETAIKEIVKTAIDKIPAPVFRID